MKIVDVNAAIAAASTASFLAAYGITNRLMVDTITDAFIALCERWYNDHGKEFDMTTELLDGSAIDFAINGIAQIHDMAMAVGKMMSFGE